MSKTPNQASGYFAVRKGSNIQNCIFLRWEDCLAFVKDDSVAQYHVFDTLEEADAYLREAPLVPAVPVPAAYDAPSVHADAAAVIPAKQQYVPILPKIAASPVAAHVPAAASSKKRPRNDDEVARRKSYRPTKKWEEMFRMLEQSIESGSGEHEVDDKLKHWMKDQKYSPSMSEEKIRRLGAIGFDFSSASINPAAKINAEKDAESSSPASKKPRIYKRWRESCDKLKVYMDANDGSCEIDANDEQNAKLREWVGNQQQEFRKWSEGQDANMTEEKVKELEAIGFQFTYVKWDERIEELKAYKAKHGNFSCVLDKEPELGKWMRSIRRQCRNFLETKKPTRDLTAERLQQLNAIGFDPTKRQGKTEQDDHAEWEANFCKLLQYKKDHRTCNVTQTDETLELFHWMNIQRLEYRKLKQGKPCKLTATRIMRLTELGFEFMQRGSYQNWYSRIEQMKQFKEQHGHVNIPCSHEELGEFVSRQRFDYRKQLEGVKTAMSEERIQILTDLGFNFCAGKPWEQSKKLVSKAWEERFQELVEFKQMFGHCIVPQHSQHIPGLGGWVKEQRKNYKLMMDGKKGSMTAERALKLANVGFVFSVSEHIKNQKSSGATEGV